MAWFRNAAAWGASFSQSQEEETRDKTPERTKKRTDTDHRTPNRDGGAEETGARHRGRHDESIGGNDSGFEDEGSDGSFGNNASDSNKEGESDNEDFDYSRRPLPEKEDDGDDSGDDATESAKEDDGDDSGDDATESAVEAPRLGAPRGERKWKPVQVATKDTKKQAIAEGKKRVGANTKFGGGNSFLYYADCADHESCTVKFKVQPTVGKPDLPKKAKDYLGTWGVFFDPSQTHAGSSVPYEGAGVSHEWRDPLKLRFDAGFGPRGATVDLQAQNLREGASSANFPSKIKITAFYNAVKLEVRHHE